MRTSSTLKNLMLLFAFNISLSVFSQTYKASQYGIRLDSSLNDQAPAIQAMINDVVKKGGGTINFDKGAAYVNQTVWIYSGVYLVGHNTQFFASSSATPKSLIVFNNVTNAGIKGFSFKAKPNQVSVLKGLNGVGYRNGPTSNVTAVTYKRMSSHLKLDSLSGDGLEFLIFSNDGGLGTAGISSDISVTNLYAYHCQQPVYCESTNGFVGKNWHFIQWPAAQGDVLNHALYMQKQLSNFTLSNYTFENGGGVLITAAGRDSKLYNGTLKNCYAAIAFNDSYEQGNFLADGLTVDSCDYMVFQSYNAVNITVTNFLVKRYHGSNGTGGPCMINSRSTTGGMLKFTHGKIYGNNNSVATAQFFVGQGNNYVVFDSVEFNDYSTNRLFFTNNNGVPAHQSLVITNCKFYFKYAAIIPVLFELRNSAKSLVGSTSFVLDKTAADKYVATNKIGDDKFFDNKIFGFKGIKWPVLDLVSTEMGTAVLNTPTP